MQLKHVRESQLRHMVGRCLLARRPKLLLLIRIEIQRRHHLDKIEDKLFILGGKVG